jgi:hypothetical protein
MMVSSLPSAPTSEDWNFRTLQLQQRESLWMCLQEINEQINRKQMELAEQSRNWCGEPDAEVPNTSRTFPGGVHQHHRVSDAPSSNSS